MLGFCKSGHIHIITSTCKWISCDKSWSRKTFFEALNVVQTFKAINWHCSRFVHNHVRVYRYIRTMIYIIHRLSLHNYVCYVCMHTFPLAFFQLWSNYQVQIDTGWTVSQFLISLPLQIHEFYSDLDPSPYI